MTEPLAYEKSARRPRPRGWRRLFSMLLLSVAASIWPMTLIFGGAGIELVQWIWGGTEVSCQASASWNRSGACVAFELWRKRWISREAEYWQSLPTRPIRRVHIEFSRFAVMPANSQVKPKDMGPLAHVAGSSLSLLGVQFITHQERTPIMDTATGASGIHSKNSIQFAMPSWFLAVISLSSLLLILRVAWPARGRFSRAPLQVPVRKD